MSDDVTIPDNLPGIDLEASTLRKRPALFLKGIKQFRENQQNFEPDFRCAMDNDTEEAIRLAHSLKGLAGTFGATSLQQAALKLEQDCKEHRSDLIESALGDVVENLQVVFSGIDRLD